MSKPLILPPYRSILNKRPKSLLSKHLQLKVIDESCSKTPELKSRLFFPGFQMKNDSSSNKPPPPIYNNRNNRPLTAKIVNISRQIHSKDVTNNDEFFLLPNYSEIQPKGYPKLKRRPHSFNNNSRNERNKTLDQSKTLINNRYQEDSNTNDKSISFYVKKQNPSKPTLSKEAQNSLNKFLGKEKEFPYIEESLAINPYHMFQKLVEKSKKKSHSRSKNQSFAIQSKLLDLSSIAPITGENLQKLNNDSNRKNSFVKENETIVDPDFTLFEESELSYIKIKSIDEFIEMIKTKQIHPAEFIYLIKSKQSDAYDLKVVSYFTITRLKLTQYFTLSPKGMTCFEKGLPQEFVFLGDWLRERDQYLALKSLSFFKKFRKWKTLKKWEKLLQIQKNKKVAKILSENLFQVHNIYQKILIKHRSFTANIEGMRLMDLSFLMEVKTLEEFSLMQEKKRRLIFDYLQILSDQMHESCKQGLQILMDRIKNHIRSELSEEDEQFGLMNKFQAIIDPKKQNKADNKKGLIEFLNLPEKLSYQHRSLLRNECLKVLRFAYLLDFLTIESLATVYMNTLKDFLSKIQRMKSPELKTTDFMKKRPQELDPLILIKARFVSDFLSRRDPRIDEVEIDGFDITSHIQDFDLKLFAEFTDQPFIFELLSDRGQRRTLKENIINMELTDDKNLTLQMKPSKEIHLTFTLPKKINSNPDSLVKFKREVSNLPKVWLEFVPRKHEFLKFLTDNFTEGLQILQSVKKWSKSQEFIIYVNTLEDWDQIIGESWIPQPEKQYLDPSSWLKLGRFSKCEMYLNDIMKIFDYGIARIEDFRNGFWPFLDLYWKVKNTDYQEILSDESLAHPQEIFVLCMKFLEFGVKFCEDYLKEGVDLGLFHIDCEDISKEIKAFFNEINGKIQGIILEVYRTKAQKLRRFLLFSLKRVGNIILKIEDFIDQKENIEKITQILPSFRAHKEKLEMIYQVLTDDKLPLTKDDKDVYMDIPHFESQLSNKLQEFESSSNKTVQRFQVKLSETYVRFRSEAEEIHTELTDPLFLEFTEEVEQIIMKLHALRLKVNLLTDDVEKYQSFANRLQIKGFDELKELEAVKKDVEIKVLLWESLNDWTELIVDWHQTPFIKLDTEELGHKSEKYWKVALHCEKNLIQNPVIHKFKTEVSEFKELFPVISALKSSYLKTSHWNELYDLIFNDYQVFSPKNKNKARLSKIRNNDKIFETSQKNFYNSLDQFTNSTKNLNNSISNENSAKIPHEKSLRSLLHSEDFTLNNLIQMNLLVFKDQIIEISLKAQQENALEKMLIDLEKNFEEKGFKLRLLDDTSDIMILIETDELYQTLDETISSINGLLASKYSQFLKKRAENLQKNVLILEDLLEKWIETQAKWLYFSKIFSMSEVKRDLMIQVIAFDSNDKNLKHLMKRLALSPFLIKLLKTTGLLDQFLKILESFIKLERDLEAYLDAKRGIFARLCFLSNEELLDLLSKSQDINQIQPFLLKIFDNIYKLNLLGDLSIPSIISQEGELLELKKFVYLKGSLENWLENLQISVQETLKKLFRKGFQDNILPGITKIDFIENQIGQIGSLVLAVNWTMAIEGVLIEKSQKGFEEIYDISLLQLEKLITKLQNCDNLLALKLRNQLMVDLLSRDLLQKLILENVIDLNDFVWQQNLRIYHDLDSNEIILRQLTFNFPYCFEYQGLKPRLVITPLTSRCFLTVSTAFNEGLGVSLWGPAGTGKTETVKELAKYCGVFCLVFNCSEQISHKTLSQLLMGFIMQGVWGCLDEFNRLSLDVLSTISQQLLTIRMALMLKQNEIDFEGKLLNFKRKTYGFCITMNPGYKGRRELPENLKALLRSIYMMLPNFEIIAEVLLISQGFYKAKDLANKLTRLYQLCEAQLSYQNHYDFGLRALKALLLGLDPIGNKIDSSNEEYTIIRALEKVNIGKLLPNDITLFRQLIADVFPLYHEKIANRSSFTTNSLELEFETKLSGTFEELGYQSTPHFISKASYLSQCLKLRFGVILLGSSRTGKTTTFKVLSNLMNISIITLNPKSVALTDLFGSMNKNGEWKEGLGSFLIKEANLKSDPSWLMFDGPIDSSWIENLNSVLDDNKTLCLANSERIRLKENMRFLFETNELKSASPATISRCGVVYFSEPEQFWIEIFQSWIDTLQRFKNEDSLEKCIEAEITNTIKEMGLKVLKDGFEGLKNLGEERVEMKCVKGICNVFEVILYREEVNLDGNKEELKRKLNYIWAYAFIWGACSLFDIPNNKLEYILKETFKNLLFPLTDNIFQLRLDPYHYSSFTISTRSLEYFSNNQIPKNTLFIPTIDVIPYLFILRNLIAYKKPILFFGSHSTYKTTMISYLLENVSTENEESPCIYNTFYYPLFRTCSPKLLQGYFEKSCHKKNKNSYGSKIGKQNLFFIDDLNLGESENSQSGQSLELLRQVLEFSGVYDHIKYFWKKIEDTAFLAAYSAQNPHNQNNFRIYDNFQKIFINVPDHHFLKRLFESFLNDHFSTNPYSEEVKALLNPLISANLELYRRVKEYLKPIPRKFYYEFSIKEIKSTFQGLLLGKTNPYLLNNKEGYINLWVHELYRVFYDRLNEDNDRLWFKDNVKAIVNQFFQVSLNIDPTNYFFSDILRIDSPILFYEEVKDFNKIQRSIEERLLEDSQWKSDAFIMSPEVMGYLLKLIRILKFPIEQKHALNLGLIGSGKKTLCKIAAFIRKMQIWEFNTTSYESFQEDLKRYMIKSMVSKDQYVLIFNDSSFEYKEIVSTISLLMNPLAPITEIHENFDELVTEALKTSKNKDHNVSLDFKSRAFVMLCGSPENTSLQKSLREFSLMRFCSGIIYYSSWGFEALLNVSQGLIKDHVELQNLTVEIYQIVENEATFQAINKPKVYLSPKSYVEMIQLFKQVYKKQGNAIQTKIKTLTNGLNKLAASQALVSTLSKSLVALEPQLILQSQKTEEIYKKLALDQIQANEKEAIIIQETEALNLEMSKFHKLWTEAQTELDNAYPLLLEAQKALNALNKNDISEIRTFNNPPPIVAMVLEAVCVLLEEKTDWGSIKAVMTDVDFLGRLVALDKEKMKENTIRKLRILINKPDFDTEQIGQKSLACKSLAIWCKAIENYNRVERIVRPKRQKAHEMNKILDDKKKLLAEKTKELDLSRSKLSELQTECDSNLALRQKVIYDIEKTRLRLANSEKLNVLLSSEEDKWQLLLQKLEVDESTILGDSVLLSACLSYFGPFKPLVRDKLLENWMDRFVYHDIITHNSFKLNLMLFSDTQIGKWVLNGLPNDERAIENGVIIMASDMKPCVILDPEGIGLNWMKMTGYKIYPANSLNKSALHHSLSLGECVVIDGFIEPLEEILQIIIEWKVILIDGMKKILFPEGLVNVNENFRLILTSRQQDMNISSTLFLKTNVVNFQVTYEGLMDQLLSDVIWLEKQELEKSYNQINTSMNRDKENLAICEERILTLLDRPSEYTILDDEELLTTLEMSKLQSEEIQRNLNEGVILEAKILTSRGVYKEIAALGSSLYFTIKGLILLQPIYYYSLEAFKKSYKSAFILKDFKEENQLEKRLQGLKKQIMSIVYEKTSYGVFYEHKRVFGLMMIMDLNRRKGVIPDTLWELFIKGKSPQTSSDSYLMKNKPLWLKDELWGEVLKFIMILKSEAQMNFMRSFIERSNEWKIFVESSYDPSFNLPFLTINLYDFGPKITSVKPNDLKTLEMFIKAYFLKVFKQDSLVLYIDSWISNSLGSQSKMIEFNEIHRVYSNIDFRTPLLILLAPGTDPTEILLRLSKEKHKPLQLISLNKNVHSNKKSFFGHALEKAKELGSWVLIQNCHLSISMLSELSKYMDFDSNNCHQDFRMILTTNPIESFPINILSQVFKYAFQKQQNLKSALQEVFNGLNSEDFEGTETQKSKEEWMKWLFNLSVFHAIVRTRGNFGNLGFSKPYEFNLGDFDISKNLLKRGFSATGDLEDMWESLNYLIGNINYGGRILEDLDLNIIFALLKKYLNSDDNLNIFKEDSLNYAAFKKTIDSFPDIDDPELYGLNENSLVILRSSFGKKLVEEMNKGECFNEMNELKSKESIVLSIMDEIKAIIPQLLDLSKSLNKSHDKNFAISLCLYEEIEKYNNLINLINKNLEKIRGMIEGKEQNNPEIDEIFNCLYNNKVPVLWKEIGYITSKPLMSWMMELSKKIKFIKEWMSDDNIPGYWLGGFMNQKRLFTSVLQDYSRIMKIPLEKLTFRYKVEDFNFEKMIQLNNKNSKENGGIFIYGLFLESASWDVKQEILINQKLGQLNSEMPVIQAIPFEILEDSDNILENCFSCPLFKTHRTVLELKQNLIGFINLKTKQKTNEFWILRGTNLICQKEE